MLKNILAGCCFALLANAAAAQTLFTYAGDTVTVKEFINAYQKNNTAGNDTKALQQYLDLYIASRLKIKEAKARGYDTLPSVVADLQSLREQIVPAYLKDEESVDRLAEEAFDRSQKDIHLAHLFISFAKDGIQETAAACQKAQEAYRQLQQGKPFAGVARQFSDDPSAKENGGDMGFITVFSLPYELENLAYGTPAGKLSKIYKSKAGYHIFKNLGERKALGRIKVAQILLAFPPEADAATKQVLKKQADSLYNRLLKGDDFGRLATAFSNDLVSAPANGQLPEFGVGHYDGVFEKMVFGLPKDGAISPPFATAHGYHIVKRLARVPVATAKNKAIALPTLRERVEASDRMATTTAALTQRILQTAGYQKKPFSEAALWAYTDSLLDQKKWGIQQTLQPGTPLFNLGTATATVEDWITYAQTYRYKEDGSGLKPYTQVWEAFVQARAMEYYKNHLEDYNEAFRQQLNEFTEGSLFFEIMQRQVWNGAPTDSATLAAYYHQHSSKYRWEQSADAVLFFAQNAAAAKSFKVQLTQQPGQWKKLVSDNSDQITADSARFELSQIPHASKQAIKSGMITTPVVNEADGTASFAYVIRTYNQPVQRSFAEARGQVLNDYQAELEKTWVEELKKKYPVTINQQAWKTLQEQPLKP